MSSDAAELLAAMTTAGLGVFAMVGLAVRYVLLPWLERVLVKPLLERLDTLSTDMVRISADTKVAAAMYDGHIERSSAEWGRIWAAIHKLQKHRREDTTT
jgi:hypothetical protein